MATAMRPCIKIIPLSRVPSMKMSHLKVEQIQTSRQLGFVKARLLDKLHLNRRLVVHVSSMRNSDVESDNPTSLADTIERFYESINKKHINQLGKFISNDCSLEDCSFPHTFEGKEEVMSFFSELLASMGQSFEFKIGNICLGDDFDAGVTWHLEWNKKRIPFTRGCTFFKCSNDQKGELVIKKFLIVTESPMKPGGSALNILKVVRTIFEKFPKAAEWFLKSPQEMLQVIVKIYSMFFKPFLSPILAWYIKLGKLITHLLSFVINIVLFISKTLSK